jgi:hypothetical protein
MPELYGQPFKDELRAEIRQLGTDLWNERKEHRLARDRLEWAWVKIAELEAKIKRMEQKARELVTEATQEIDPNVVTARLRQERREKCEAIAKAAGM